MSREKKKESLISITHFVQGLNITTSQNSITENGSRFSLYGYKAIVRCTHLVACILHSAWMQILQLTDGEQNIKSNCSPPKFKLLNLYPCCRI